MTAQVANGMDAREAWKACGKPRGEQGIQNVRQRGMKARGKMGLVAAMLEVAVLRDEQYLAASPDPLPEASEANSIGVPEKGFRLSTGQLQKQKSVAIANRSAHDAAYIAATLEWQQMVREGKCGKGDSCADAVAKRHAKTLPATCNSQLEAHGTLPQECSG